MTTVMSALPYTYFKWPEKKKAFGKRLLQKHNTFHI